MRLPYQTIVIPYKRLSGDFRFLILKRADLNFWQWVSGGGEDEDRNTTDTVVRETKEEIDVSVDLKDIIKLESRATIFEDKPVTRYKNGNITVVPEYAFGLNIKEADIKISEEHKEYRWVTSEVARKLLKYDSNKNALLELERIIRKEVDGSWKINWES